MVVRKQEEAHLSGRRKARFQLGSFRFSFQLAQQVCIVPYNGSCARMIGSQCLFPDAPGALKQRLSLGVLALLLVEGCQPVQRRGHIGMVRSQCLVPDAQAVSKEGFRFAIARTILKIDACLKERLPCSKRGKLSLLNEQSALLGMGWTALVACIRAIIPLGYGLI